MDHVEIEKTLPWL